MRQNPSGAIHPTVFMFAWLAATIGLQTVRPLHLPELPWLELVGKIMVGLAVILLVWAHLTLRGHGTTADHSRATTALVTDGPFRLSRNPVYVSLVGFFLAMALIYANAWALILVAPFVVALLRLTIIPEEKYLEHQFGTDYLRYRDQVRRWL